VTISRILYDWSPRQPIELELGDCSYLKLDLRTPWHSNILASSDQGDTDVNTYYSVCASARSDGSSRCPCRWLALHGWERSGGQVDVGRGMDSRLDLASWGRVGVRMWEEEVRCFDRVLHSPPFWFVMWEQKQSAASAVVVMLTTYCPILRSP
jgi:hypothetical protein